MPNVTQKFLTPGRYHIGGGKYREFTADDLTAFASGTKAVLAAGHSIPVLYEHAEPGSDKGAPQQFSARDRRAKQVEHGVGWLKDVKIGSDGAMEHTLELTDPKAAEAVKNGSIKFTSPELRYNWTDGKGRPFKNFIAHVALTHKPRNPDQGAMVEEALQFSMEDLVESDAKATIGDQIQMADDPDDKPKDDPPADPPADPPENPDAPKPEPTADDQQFQAVIAHLAGQGIPLPSDTKPENFVERLLGALLVVDAAKKQAEAEAAEDEEEEDDEEPIQEEKPPMQFSVGDLDTPGFDKLRAKVIRGELARLKHLAGKLPPAARDRLFARENALQFSADGDELPSFKLGEVLEILHETCPPSFWMTAADVDQFSAEHHPRPEFHKRPDRDEITDEEAEAIADEVFGKRKTA